MSPRIGVLALQGDFAAHVGHLRAIGAAVSEIRTRADLTGVDGVVLPGGESTTMSLLLRSSDLLAGLDDAIRAGVPVFGTCAGLIMLGTRLLDGRDDQSVLAALDITVRRNGYGRQLQSFEVDLDIAGLIDVGGDRFHAVFIRAPRIEQWGPTVTVLAEHAGTPVLVRQGSVIGCAFHPELTRDLRLHRWFVEEVVGRGPNPPSDVVPTRHGDVVPTRHGDVVPTRQGDVVPTRQGDVVPTRHGDVVPTRHGDVVSTVP